MQKQIQSILDRQVAEGKERGVQFAAYVDGKLVVDAWAGVADVNTGAKVSPTTLFPVFSTTKGIATTLIHLLVERGLISYDTPVSKVWPEFGAHGKSRVTLHHVLGHSAGVPQMPSGIGFKEMCDWDEMCRRIADLTPLWKPGTKIEYHAMTFGWIAGEIAHRVTGRSFKQLLEDEIKKPLGIEGMYVGIPEGVDSRIAFLEEPAATAPSPATGPEPIPAWMGPLHAIMNRADVRRACIAATSGIMTARDLARHYAALLSGGVDGVEFFSDARRRAIIAPQKPEHPEGDYPKNRVLGYVSAIEDSSMLNRATAFGHVGFGGSLGFADPESRLAIGYTKNLYQPGNGFVDIMQALRAGLA